MRNTQSYVDMDRPRLITEFYSRPSMDNYILRRAKAFRYFLENKKIFIDEDSQIAGHLGGESFRAVVLHPDVRSMLDAAVFTHGVSNQSTRKVLPIQKSSGRGMW